jgi:putative endopeptidase
VRTARLVSCVAVALALLAPVAPVLAADEPSAIAASAAPKGIELADVDRAASACTDFYAFANGAWRAANPIPPGAQRWSRRLAAREANRQQLEALLAELAKKADRPRGSVEQLLGDHFAACMDEPAADAAGLRPLAPLLAEIAAVRDEAGVQRMIRRLNDLAIPAPFGLTGASDDHDPARVVANIAAGGLGLPGRDHYVGSEPRFVEARETYRAHVATVLGLGGMSPAAARKAAEDILALETRGAAGGRGPRGGAATPAPAPTP